MKLLGHHDDTCNEDEKKKNQFVLKVVINMLKIGLRKFISLIKFRLMK
jgi:hypothetical protein